MSEERLQSLLLAWQEQQSRGSDMTAAELCRDCPELAEELARRIAVLRRVNGLLHPPGNDAQAIPPPELPAEAHGGSLPPADGPASRTATPLRPGSDPHRASDTVAPAGPPSAASAGWPQVPGYEILSELGRGGMGVVYQARQTALDRVVALKMILSGGLAGAHERSRFKIEAEAVARLQHPNVVQVFEVGEAQGRAGLPGR
jgi:hypothetical protein